MARPKKNIDPRQEERLRTVIEEEGITQNKLAEVTQSSRQSISRYINCKDQLPDYVALAIANAYGYNPSWLLCLDERKWRSGLDYEAYFDDYTKAIWTIMNAALLDDDLQVTFIPNSNAIFDRDNPPYSKLSEFGNFVIEDKKSQTVVRRLPNNGLSIMGHLLVNTVKYMIFDVLKEGEIDDGEH